MHYQVCLFSNDRACLNNTNNLYSKACELFQDAFQYRNLSSSAHGYEYCDMWDLADQVDFKGCTDCLQADGKTRYLANCK